MPTKSSTHDDLAKAWPPPTADQLKDVSDRLDMIAKELGYTAGVLSNNAARLMYAFLAHDDLALNRWYTRCVRLDEDVVLRGHLKHTLSLIGELLRDWQQDRQQQVGSRPAHTKKLEQLRGLARGFHNLAGGAAPMLSDNASLVYEVLLGLAEHRGMTGRAIVDALFREHSVNLDESTFRKYIKPALEPYGLEHVSRIGYRIRPDRRPTSQ